MSINIFQSTAAEAANDHLPDQTSREVVAIFNTFDQLQQAIDDLELSGFERRDISILGSENAVKKAFGKSTLPPEFLENHPDTPRASSIKLEEIGLAQSAVIGGGLLTGVVSGILAAGAVTIPGAIVATALIGGAGGAAGGAMLAKLLGNKYAQFFEHQMEKGGLLLWVNTPDLSSERQAITILRRHHGRGIHAHDVPTLSRDDATQAGLSPAFYQRAFIQLDELSDKHESVLRKDRLMHRKIDALLCELKALAANDQPVTQERAQVIVDESTIIAEEAANMAHAQQRIIEESMQEASGSEERETARYFALRQDLLSFTDALEAHLRRQAG